MTKVFPEDPYLDAAFWERQLQGKVKLRPAAAGILTYAVRLLVTDVLDCVLRVKAEQTKELATNREQDLSAMSAEDWQELGDVETNTGNPLYAVTRADLSLALHLDQDLAQMFKKTFFPRIHSQLRDKIDTEEDQAAALDED